MIGAAAGHGRRGPEQRCQFGFDGGTASALDFHCHRLPAHERPGEISGLAAEKRGAHPRIGRERTRGPSAVTASDLQDVGAIGDRERLRDVLLGEQHGRPAPADRPHAFEHLVHEQRRQAERRLVEQQQLGRAISARPIASICCCPPESCQPSVL